MDSISSLASGKMTLPVGIAQRRDTRDRLPLSGTSRRPISEHPPAPANDTVHYHQRIIVNEKEKADKLFACLDEYQRHPQSSATACGQRYLEIYLDDHAYWVSSSKITLPSGETFWRGHCQGRQVAAYEDVIYISDTLPVTGLSAKAGLWLLMAHLTATGNLPAARRPAGHQSASCFIAAKSAAPLYGLAVNTPYPVGLVHRPHPSDTLSRSLGEFRPGPQRDPAVSLLTRRVTAMFSQVHHWIGRLTTPLMKLLDALTLPAVHAASASETEHQHELPLLQPRWPDTLDNRFVASWNINLTALFSLPKHRTDAMAQSLGLHTLANFGICTHAFDLHNRKARQLFFKLYVDFKNQYSSSDGMMNLILFDQYIGEWITKIFNNGLFLKKEDESLNIIVIKAKLENIIHFHLNCKHYSDETLHLLHAYLNHQIRLQNYLSRINIQINDALAWINTTDIATVIEMTNGMDYDDGFAYFSAHINAQNETKTYENYMIILAKMREVNLELLDASEYKENESVYERIIFNSEKELLKALIYENQDAIIATLYRKIFYYIFDYNRINGFSLQGKTFYMPGELSPVRFIFDQEEESFDVKDVEKIITDDINNFISNTGKATYYINRAMKILELAARMEHEDPLDIMEDTSDMLIKHESIHKKAQNIVKGFIDRNTDERKKMYMNHNWIQDISLQIREDKTMLFLLEYLEEMQNSFYERYFLCKRNLLQLENYDIKQQLTMAKILSIKKEYSNLTLSEDDEIYLQEFNSVIHEDRSDLLIEVAANWRCLANKNDHIGDHTAIMGLLALRKFQQEENMISQAFAARSYAVYSSILELRPSEEIDNLEAYYNQFIEYKYHDAIHEAKHITFRAVSKASFGYIDLIFPPQRILIFKLFSRHYVKNPAMPNVWVSSPKKNLGFLAIVVLPTGKTVILSTLGLICVLRERQDLAGSNILRSLRHFWETASEELTLSARKKHVLTSEELSLLLHGPGPVVAPGVQDRVDLEKMSIIPAEKEQVDYPAAVYSLAAVKELPVTRPLLDLIDELNEKTLIETSEELKNSLRRIGWGEFIAYFIPFSEMLWRHWHDQAHEIAFHEIYFDLVDSFVTVGLAAKGVGKIASSTIKTILNDAIVKKIPKEMIKNYVIHRLIEHAPGLGYQAAQLTASTLFSLINPLPLPYPFILKMSEKYWLRLSNSISDVNLSILKSSGQKKKNRQFWKSVIDKNQLIRLQDDIYTNNENTLEKKYYIHLFDEFYRVHRDHNFASWRVISPHYLNDINFAVPIIKSKENKWVSYYPLQADFMLPSPDTTMFSMEKSTDDHIRFEPTYSPRVSLSSGTHEVSKHLRALYIALNRKILNHNLSIHSSNSGRKFLFNLAKEFHSDSFYRDLLAEKNSLSGSEKLIESLRSSLSGRADSVSIRTLLAWRTEHDLRPRIHNVIKIDLPPGVFIIDPSALVPEWLTHVVTREVLLEQEWLAQYARYFPKKYPLVKYADISDIDKARELQGRTPPHPGEFLAGAVLLREPVWFKTMVTRLQLPLRLPLPNKRSHEHTLRKIVRSDASWSLHKDIPESYALNILKKAKVIDQRDYELLLSQTRRALMEPVSPASLMQQFIELKNFSDVLKINEGKLLAVFENNILKSLAVSMGNGRFAIAGGGYFDLLLPDKPAIITAEEMFFPGNQEFFLRGNHRRQLSIFAGAPRGAKDLGPLLSADLPQREAMQHDDLPHATRSAPYKTRAEVLLGKDWGIEYVNGLPSFIRLRGHGAPFNFNHIDAVELAHVIRGLAFNEVPLFDLNSVDRIELYSCFSGYGGRYSLAQILADELRVKVKAYPSIITHAISLRRPDWFLTFEPDTRYPERMSDLVLNYIEQRIGLTKNRIHMRLHDLFSLLIRLRRANLESGPSRRKRHSYYIPSIFIDIARVIIKDLPIEEFMAHYEFTEKTLNTFSTLLNSYSIYEISSDDIFLQAYYDILLSVKEFNYLFTWVEQS
ncbi:hypothetical protein [Martelella alba]|uniref:Uncharacterized protein n=1 Tax=Martelella alba TaxID=2590451 RepID=A0ABY2SMT2_9HYPH|nr:hypothetical protein [Martelella alba]TKI06693.1 hypothetical protein FCN80_08845 [Martelella alba]